MPHIRRPGAIRSPHDCTQRRRRPSFLALRRYRQQAPDYDTVPRAPVSKVRTDLRERAPRHGAGGVRIRSRTAHVAPMYLDQRRPCVGSNLHHEADVGQESSADPPGARHDTMRFAGPTTTAEEDPEELCVHCAMPCPTPGTLELVTARHGLLRSRRPGPSASASIPCVESKHDADVVQERRILRSLRSRRTTRHERFEGPMPNDQRPTTDVEVQVPLCDTDAFAHAQIQTLVTSRAAPRRVSNLYAAQRRPGSAGPDLVDTSPGAAGT
ncbi:hypothetical protein OH76DRAFT_1114209 [Lentinus brumalis]|uniref:Uncharacterized protein n=1 Tax=Lentinus brumalis TaxID=2498619 RepID=A0A371CV13_9APHY|nr:hypothetical protein OH76DRAFT_1114209 [Polyporus brumalis]